MTYKIKDKNGMFSLGMIRGHWDGGASKSHYVQWSLKKGKEWTEEKLVKAHLLKCLQNGIGIEGWEVIEVKHLPTKPILDWVDGKMLLKVLGAK